MTQVRQRRLRPIGELHGVPRILLGILPLAALLIIWWVGALLLNRARVYPTPDIVVGALIEIASGRGELGPAYFHIAATLGRLGAAFTISIVVGTLLGILAGRVRLVFSLLENILWIFMAVPSIVWVFIFAVAFGISNFVPIAAVAALLTPMVLVNVAEGAKSVPSDIVEMSDSYKVTRWERLTGIFLPFLVPYLVSSARTAFGLGVKLVVVAEVVGLASGVGYEIQFWYDRLFMGPIVAWGIVMVLVGLIVDYGVFGPLERRVSRWKGRPMGEFTLGEIS
jgi:NitT/TauT family transport system permease protein